MHQTLTFGSLFGGLFLAGGGILFAIAALAFFAGGMSDSPSAGAEAAGTALKLFMVALLVGGVGLYGCISP